MRFHATLHLEQVNGSTAVRHGPDCASVGIGDADHGVSLFSTIDRLACGLVQAVARVVDLDAMTAEQLRQLRSEIAGVQARVGELLDQLDQRAACRHLTGRWLRPGEHPYEADAVVHACHDCGAHLTVRNNDEHLTIRRRLVPPQTEIDAAVDQARDQARVDAAAGGEEVVA